MRTSRTKLRMAKNTDGPARRDNPDHVTEWSNVFDWVMTMPDEHIERLEQTLLKRRVREGVTVPQMELLRAIHARRTAPGFSKPA